MKYAIYLRNSINLHQLRKVHLGLCLRGSSHRGRSGHVAEKIKVVDILRVEPKAKREREREGESPVTHHDNEICTVMKP